MPEKAELLRQLVQAVKAEHYGCTDNTCDISVALEQDLPLWAARIFVGATECPETEETYCTLRNLLGNAEFERLLEEERQELLKVPHKECPGCGALVWREGYQSTWVEVVCGNCLYEFPREDEEEEDEEDEEKNDEEDPKEVPPMPTKVEGLDVPQPKYAPEDYPLYEMVLNITERRWLSLRDAAGWFDQGYVACRTGTHVVDKFGELPRMMTTDDQDKIRELADGMSANK